MAKKRDARGDEFAPKTDYVEFGRRGNNFYGITREGEAKKLSRDIAERLAPDLFASENLQNPPAGYSPATPAGRAARKRAAPGAWITDPSRIPPIIDPARIPPVMYAPQRQVAAIGGPMAGRGAAKYKPVVFSKEDREMAIGAGIQSLLSDNPRLKTLGSRLLDYLNGDAVAEAITKGYTEIRRRIQGGQGLSVEDQKRFLFTYVSNAVRNGSAFDEVGYKIINHENLVGRLKDSGMPGTNWMGGKKLNFWNRFRAWRVGRKGNKYEDKAAGMAEVYETIRGTGLETGAPGLYKAAETVRDMQTAHLATEIMGAYQLITPGRQYVQEKRIEKVMKRNIKAGTRALDQYVASKAVASIFALIGIGLLFATGFGLTGNVINNAAGGGVNGSWAGIALSVFFLAIAGLVLIGRKKKE